jgi:hypothetical protein
MDFSPEKEKCIGTSSEIDNSKNEWMEFAMRLAEAGPAKVVEDRKRLAEILERQNAPPEKI